MTMQGVILTDRQTEVNSVYFVLSKSFLLLYNVLTLKINISLKLYVFAF